MKKIVIVDDEYVVIEGLKKLVDWAKYDARVVGCATNGSDGLKLIHSEQPDIVFTDIKMPIMNGLMMIDEAKKGGCDCIYIIFSGYNEFTYAREALSLGVISYIEKPVTIEQIETAMERACRIYDKKNAASPATPLAPEQEAYSNPIDWSTPQTDSIKQLAINISEMRLAIQRGEGDHLMACLDKHFNLLEQDSASLSVIAHECLRILYIALAEIQDAENEFVRDVMGGTPPYIEISNLKTVQALKTWIVQRLNDVLKWIQQKNHTQMHPAVIQAIEYIRRHFTEPISLQEIADAVHINAAYLSTLFKKEVGISYVKYLTDLRLNEARKRLSAGERVGIVCLEVGFKDGRHFAKLYKEKYGVTPERVKNRKE